MNEALIDALLRQPLDEAAWMVAADELTGQGDVRGEVMALQCKGALSTAERALEARLIKRHAAALCGVLGPVVEPRSVEVQRGVVTGLRLEPVDLATLAPLLGAPLWRFVRWVDFGAVEEPVLWRALEALPWLTGLGGLPMSALARLPAHRAALVERLGVQATERFRQEVAASVTDTLTARRFPALRALRTGGRYHVAGALGLLANLPALERLSVANLRADRLVEGELAFADWVPPLEPTALAQLELREDDGAGFWSTKRGWVVCLARDPERRFSRLQARFHSFPSRVVGPFERLAQGLRRWLPRLTEVEVTGVRLLPNQRAELEAMFSAVPASKRQLG